MQVRYKILTFPEQTLTLYYQRNIEMFKVAFMLTLLFCFSSCSTHQVNLASESNTTQRNLAEENDLITVSERKLVDTIDCYNKVPDVTSVRLSLKSLVRDKYGHLPVLVNGKLSAVFADSRKSKSITSPVSCGLGALDSSGKILFPCLDERTGIVTRDNFFAGRDVIVNISDCETVIGLSIPD